MSKEATNAPISISLGNKNDRIKNTIPTITITIDNSKLTFTIFPP